MRKQPAARWAAQAGTRGRRLITPSVTIDIVADHFQQAATHSLVHTGLTPTSVGAAGRRGGPDPGGRANLLSMALFVAGATTELIGNAR